MEYSKLISVTGLPGLYELVASKNDGAIVRSLDDKNTRFVSSRIHNFSHLESIEVYTESDNVNLADVFHAMQNSKEKLPDEKDAAAVKKYFQQVYPTMDFERVYASDMKKMVKWFDVLKKNDVDIKLSEDEALKDDEDNGQKEDDSKEEKDPNKQPEEKPKVEEPVNKPAVEAKEPKKPKAAKAKKAEAVTSEKDETKETETKAAKKKNLKK